MVQVAFITDGSASHPNHPTVSPSDLAALRTSEARAATRVLGVDGSRVVFLGASDGTLSKLGGVPLKEIVDALTTLLLQVEPKTLLLPCRADGSSEHDAAFLLVSRALEISGVRPRIFEFPVWSWWNPYLLLNSMFTYLSLIHI